MFCGYAAHFQQELLATFDSIRNRDLISLYERIEAIEGSLAALSMTVGELSEHRARRLEGDIARWRRGLSRSCWPTRTTIMSDSRRYELEIEAMRRELERTNAYAEQLAAAARDDATEITRIGVDLIELRRQFDALVHRVVLVESRIVELL